MTFLHPILAAVGLACVAIPVVIHFLMRRRRKPVMWGAMRFLVEAYRRQRRRLRLEQLLLLAARCLLVMLIGLALARPALNAAGGGHPTATVYILIDNSLGSALTDSAGQTALDRHKQAAMEVLDRLDPASGDRAGLVALGGPADPLVVPASSDLAAIRQLIDRLEPTDSAADLPGAVAALNRLHDQTQPSRTIVALLGDHRAGSVDPGEPLPVLDIPDAAVLASRPAQTATTNVTLADIQPLRSVMVDSGRSTVTVTLARSGELPASVSTVRLFWEGRSEPVGRASIRWEPGQASAKAAVVVEPPPESGGNLVLSARLGDDSLMRDNARATVVAVRRSLRVGLVAPGRFGMAPGGFSPADWLGLALRPGDEQTDIELVRLEPASIETAALARLDALFITRPDAITDEGWRRVRLFVDGGGGGERVGWGGVVFVTPPADATVHLWPDAMVGAMDLGWTIAREARELDRPASITEGESLAGQDSILSLLSGELAELGGAVNVWRVLPVEGESLRVLLALSDGSPLLIAARPGGSGGGGGGGGGGGVGARGLVMFLASAPSLPWTDLPAKPLMVPLIQEIVRQGVGRAMGPASVTAGMAPVLPAGALALRSGAGEVVSLDESGRLREPIRRAGVWRVVDQSGSMGRVLAVNPDVGAGRVDPTPEADIEAWVQTLAGAVTWLDESGGVEGARAIGRVLARDGGGPPISLPLLIAALVVALIEQALARLASHARVEPGGAIGAEGGGG